MKKRLSGQMTVEASLVIPIVMMVVASFLYFSLYIHDIITVRSFAYSIGNRNIQKDFDEFESSVKTGMERIPLFVINIGVSCENQRSYYEIKIISKNNATAKWLKNIINIDDINQDIKIPKNINREIFYIYRAVSDELGDKIK